MIIHLGKVASKKNRHVIRKNRKTGQRWVAPDSEAQTHEKGLAWEIQAAACKYTPEHRQSLRLGPLSVGIRVSDKGIRLHVEPALREPEFRVKQDLDNIANTILDALQRSGVIENDNQVVRLVVEAE